MRQSTLFRTWNPPDIIIPKFQWEFLPGENWFGLWWTDPDHIGALEDVVWWFDADGNCDNWRLVV